MEGRKLGALVLVVLAFGTVVGQSTAASFKDCYVGCFIFCMLNPSNSAFSCATQCLKDCIIPNSPQQIHVDSHHFCNLGCASSLCSNISTKQNPDGERVESCVGSCSDTCAKNYLSP
ncbi:thionin-like protein 2 [Cornus florida]|uniref:thionin-like protein 2 n=1 Tax=Cornus florida TaxID=4283 RepID=UPI00289DACBC|nr:thionin-like protein 2 [Cornus florida]